MAAIGTFGERFDILFRQGASFGPVDAVMESAPGVPVNLTGCTITGEVRHAANASKVLATLTCVIGAPLLGQYSFKLTPAATAGVPAGPKTTDDDSKHVWDLRMLDAAGNVIPLYYGVVTVQHSVTRPA